MNIKERIAEAVTREKQKLKLDWAVQVAPFSLALAIAEVESSFNVYAVRYEPSWSYLVDVEKHAVNNAITPVTEESLQKHSWGLFQIMGSVAREYGYVDMLHLLATPETVMHQVNIFLRHINRLYKHYLKKYGSVDLALKFAIAGYNAGFGLKDYNTFYYSRVKTALKKYL